MVIGREISSTNYRVFIENMPQAYAYHKITFDENNNPSSSIVLEINKNFKNLLGVEDKDVLGKPITKFLPELEILLKDWFATFPNTIASERNIEFELYFESLKKWIQVTAFCPEKGYFFTQLSDVTNLKKTETVLHENEKLLSHVFEISTEGIRLIGLDKKILRANKKYCDFIGLTLDAVEGKLCTDIICTHKCRDENDCSIEKIKKGEHFPEETITITTQNGESKYFIFNLLPFINDKGKVIGVIETYKDISRLMENEILLKDNNIFLQNLIDTIPNPIFYKNRIGKYIGCNKSFIEYIGKSKEELIGASVFDISPYELAKVYHAADQALIRSKETQEYEALVKYADGAYREVLFYKDVFLDENGDVAGIMGVMHDLTGRKKAEKTVMNIAQRFKAIFSFSPNSIVLIDRYGIIKECNPSTIKLLKASEKTDLLGKKCFDWINQEQHPFVHKIFEEVKDNKKPDDFELSLTDFQGNPLSVMVSAVSFDGEQADGKDELLVIITDITELKRKTIELEDYKTVLEQRVAEKTSELQISQSNYQQIYNVTNEAIVISDIETQTIIDANQAAFDIFGIQQSQMANLNNIDNFSDGNPPYTSNEMAYFRNKVLTDGKATFEWLIRRADNTYTWVEIAQKKAIVNNNDVIISGIREINERKIIEKESHERLQRLELQEAAIVEIASNSFNNELDFKGVADSITQMVNSVVGESRVGIWRYDSERLTLNSVSIYDGQTNSFISDNSLDISECQNYIELLKNNRTVNICKEIEMFASCPLKVNYLNKNNITSKLDSGIWLGGELNSILTIEKINESSKWHHDEVIFVGEVASQISQILQNQQKKEIEKALKISDEKFKSIIQYLSDLLIIVDIDTRILYASPSVKNVLGYNLEEILNTPCMHLVHPDDLNLVKKDLSDVAAYKNDYLPTEFRVQHADGRWVTLEVVGNNLMENPAVKGIVLYARDITYRKDAERKLIESEEKFRNIFNSSHDGISITDYDGNYIETNQIVVERTGLSKEALLKGNIFDVLPVLKDNYEETSGQLIKNGFFLYTSSYVNKAGRKVYVEISSKTINFQGKKAFLHVTRDITERKEIEKKITRTIFETEEKERNRFAKDLHDGLGALLSGVKMYLNLLHKGNVTEDKRDEILTRAKDLISEAVSSTREIAYNIKPVELRRFGLVATIDAFIQRLSDISNIKFNFDASRYNVKVDIDIQLVLFRVVSELTNNSLKYADADRIDITLMHDNDLITLLYADDGKGFNVQEALIKNSDSMGLKNIISRLSSINGKCKINSTPHAGMDVLIEINL